MPSPKSAPDDTPFPDRHFLGELETAIVDRAPNDAQPEPGAPTCLVREADNACDGSAIRVETPDGQRLGYLPGEVAAWLAPLIDTSVLQLAACSPRTTTHPHGDVNPLRLGVFLLPQGQSLLCRRYGKGEQGIWHEMIRKAFQEAQRAAQPELVRALMQTVAPLARLDLLPGSRLLLNLIPGFLSESRITEDLDVLLRISRALRRVQVGPPSFYRNMAVYPLSWPEETAPPYLLLGEAIERELALVKEVSPSGSVPKLRLKNKADRPLLLPEGEILIGAKQNRVINVTVLVAARSIFKVPVSCVEQGRWRSTSKHFTSAYSAPPSLRSKKLASTMRNRELNGVAQSDQGEVWGEVSDQLAKLSAAAPTCSITDGFAAAAPRLHDYREHLVLPPEASGMLVVGDRGVCGLDLFDCSATFQRLAGQLLDAYALEAIHGKDLPPPKDPGLAERFLADVAAAFRIQHRPLGIGKELEVTGQDLVGSGVWYDERICHLSAFRTEKKPRHERITPPGDVIC